jgi:hypothetical protein
MNIVMKRFLLLTLLTLVLTTTLQAQYFVTSFGYVHNWDIPYVVSYTIEDHYRGYEVIHAERSALHGRISFNLILQRGNRFTQISVNHRGKITGTVNWDHYPLQSHICGDYCGFYSDYYLTYYRPNHHGHQHYYGCGHYVPQVKIAYHNRYDYYIVGQKIKQRHAKGKRYYGTRVSKTHNSPVKSSSRHGRTARGYKYSAAKARDNRAHRNN